MNLCLYTGELLSPFHDSQRDKPRDLTRKSGAVTGLDDGVDVLIGLGLLLGKPASRAAADEDAKAILDGVASDARSWRLAVYLSYETAVRTLFYREWERRTGAITEARRLQARARAGLSSVELADQPDYDYVNAVGMQAAAGTRLPANVR